MKQTPLVVKIGGRALNDLAALESLLTRLAAASQTRHTVLVHGGGDLIDTWLQRFERPVVKNQGLRVTQPADMPVVAGALAGALNSQLVATINALGTPACGMSLADAHWCRLVEDTARGAVGIPDIAQSDAGYLTTLLDAGLLPVVSSVGMLANGQLVNVNADLAAAAVAAVLEADLLLLTDVDAILDQQGNPVTNVTPLQAQALIDSNVVHDGMKVKLEAALQAAQLSRRSTAVAAWYNQAPLTAILNGQALASRIVLDDSASA